MIRSGGCALTNLLAGADPAGSATPFDHLFLLQVAPPWERIALSSPAAPTGVREALAALARVGVRAHAMLIDGGAAVPENGVRLLHFARPSTGLVHGYRRAEYLVPVSSAADCIEALALGKAPPCAAPVPSEAGANYGPVGSEAGAVSSPSEAPRELFVCTHGERDGCCGRFGEVAYRYLRDRHTGPNLRVWRVSHFGGHRFAPTLLDLPSGRSWGRLSDEVCDAIVTRSGSPAELASCYRGWCLLPAQAQVAERDLLIAHGWRWLNAEVQAKVHEAGAQQVRQDVPRDVSQAGTQAGRREVRGGVRQTGQPRGQQVKCFDFSWRLDGSLARRRAHLAPVATVSAPASCGAQPAVFVRYSCFWEEGVTLLGTTAASAAER